MIQGNRFISPGAWFAMTYPATWHEFEDGEGSFLFYNPDEWTGNFRISAYRGNATYGRDSLRQELADNPAAVQIRVGQWQCAYSCEQLTEDNAVYTVHVWVIDAGDMAVECSFTVRQQASAAEAEQVIASLEVRKPGVKYPAEIIPVRLSEIYQINEAYEWVSDAVKDRLKKDFQGTEEDIPSMQRLIGEGTISPKKREAWLAFGIVLCVILVNEVDGWEWRTLVDGNREVPLLVHEGDHLTVDPMKLTWSKVKAGQTVDLEQIYNDLLQLQQAKEGGPQE